MRSKEAARRLRSMADLIEELGPDGNVPILRGAHTDENGNRTIIIRISLKDTKKHFHTADRLLRIAHEAELDAGERQGVLPL